MKGLATTLSLLLPLLIFALFDASSSDDYSWPVEPFDPITVPAPSPTAVSPTGDLKKSAVYIVLTGEPPADEDMKHFCLRILSKVTGGKKAANDALIYTYTINGGFAAELTLDQVSLLEEQPEVLGVIKDKGGIMPVVFSR